jgi:prepilin-type N-terminal cleavage/methylation domain-containing protein/prepilin-type processing-associated H-X9-DG protein
MMSSVRRIGFTLVELLVVLAILAVLLGLLIPAVQKVREMAVRTDTMNRMRQVGLATTQYADVNGGFLPSLDGRNVRTNANEYSLHMGLMPYVEQGNSFNAWRSDHTYPGGWRTGFVFEVLLNPADYSLPDASQKEGADATASNARFFASRNRLDSIRDGLSNTIAHAQHLVFCNETKFNWWITDMPMSLSEPSYTGTRFFRRATFADIEMGQVVPVTAPDGSTRASVPGRTFQVRPRLSECDPTIAQSPHSGGMPVVMGDGSVRVLSPGMSETAFWSAVTPAGGEVPGNDW